MCDYLINKYAYSFDMIPKSLGGTLDPSQTGPIRYQICQSKVTHPQSSCSTYYHNESPSNSKSTNHILFFNSELEKQRNRTSLSSFSSSSLLAIAAVKPSHDVSAQVRVAKRGSSSSIDQEKRQRSNESLIEEELPRSTTE